MAWTVKNLSAMQETQFNPWVGKIPWRREWQPTPLFLPGKSHGQRSLAGCSPRGPKGSEKSDWLSTQTCAFFTTCSLQQTDVQFVKGKNQHLLSKSANPQMGEAWLNYSPRLKWNRPTNLICLWSPSPNNNVWKLEWLLTKWSKNSRGQVNFDLHYLKK